ncbi:MAG: histidine kinase [Gemmatimonadales bacterium]|jgi:signal transduction histidine kinase
MTPTQPILSRAPFRWFLYLVAWTILGAVVATIFPPRSLLSTMPRPMAAGVVELAVTFYVLGFLVPLPVLVCNFAPLGRGRLVRALLLHLVAAAAFMLIHWWLVRWSMDALIDLPRGFRGGRGPGFGRNPDLRLAMQVARHSLTTLIGYWLVVGVWHAVDSSRRLREREVHATALEAQLATARLQALEDQLHPHFLFNTLNTLSSLIYQNVDVADRVIRDLSTLLRLALDNAGRHTVPLSDEVRFVAVYLDIMKTRYPERLDVSFDIDDAAGGVAVPNLLLQPIVENSIKHGLEAVEGVIAVDVRAHSVGGRLHAEVRDNGPGLPGGDVLREGVGLRNTRDRLAQLYGDDYRFEISDLDGGGVRVFVDIPAGKEAS